MLTNLVNIGDRSLILIYGYRLEKIIFIFEKEKGQGFKPKIVSLPSLLLPLRNNFLQWY